jgi:hypothetical protein
MTNVSNLKKNIVPTTTAFDFLLWDTQNYYTIYKEGKPLMHCHFQNIDPEGEPMAGIYAMKEGESVFKLDFGIDLIEVTEKDDYELGDLLVRLMEGDDYKLCHVYLTQNATCNHADSDE